MQPSDQHLLNKPSATMQPTEKAVPSDIPKVVKSPMIPPPPRNGPKLETYSVVVSEVEVSELLFAMARDAKINVDVHPAVRGKVTVNAIEQTLPQILSRLSRQVSLRYEFDGANLVVMPDEPFVRHYPIDYVNMTRTSNSSTSVATQISSTGSGGGGEANNNSTTTVTQESSNQFWGRLVGNLRTLIDAPSGEQSNQDSAGSGGSSSSDSPDGSASAASDGSSNGQGSSTQSDASSSQSDSDPVAPGVTRAVFASPEVGMITVRGNNLDHERVQEYLDKVMNSARRQVLIEATIAEVQLSDEYQQGINWQKVALDGSGWSFTQQPDGTSPLSTGSSAGTGPGGLTFPNTVGSAIATGASTASLGVMRYLKSSADGNLSAALSLLQSFGRVKVLSSPKISVLNNQTAVLKVVDNKVYFTIDVQVTPGTETQAAVVTYTSTPHTVPVGFVMSVTPQIEAAGAVTMNIRPTISRIIGFINDPSPALAANNTVSRIPEIQTREMESILKVVTGEVAVMGGLMQESIDDQTDAVPGAANLPFIGEAFKYRNDQARKSELVVFLRPVVIKDASVDGDYKAYKNWLPDEDYFQKPSGMPVPRSWQRRDRPESKPGAQPTTSSLSRESNLAGTDSKTKTEIETNTETVPASSPALRSAMR
jgi:general secretion pathway protein D